MSSEPGEGVPDALRSWRSGWARQHRAEVPRRVDLRDDLDVQPGGEGDDLPHLRLGEVLRRHHFGVGAGLDAEGLVVGEVQAELVELEVGHLAQPVLDPADAVELARDVEVEAALRPVGVVTHLALRHHAVGAHRLLQGAGPVEDPGLIGSADPGPSVVDVEGVRLGVPAPGVRASSTSPARAGTSPR